MACLNCGNEVINTPQKRQKVFCNSTCRSNYWQKVRKLELQGYDVDEVCNIMDSEEKKAKKAAKKQVSKIGQAMKEAKNIEKGNVKPKSFDTFLSELEQPEKLNGETSIDYRIRIADWRNNKNK